MAGRAAAGAVVAGLIVGAEERQQRVEQAGLLQAEKDRIGARLGAEAAIAQFDLGGPALLRGSDCRFPASTGRRVRRRAGRCRAAKFPSAAADRETAGLPFLLRLFRRGRREGQQSLRRAIGAVALAEVRGLQRKRAVVVERRAPQHAAVGHHAGLDFSDFRGVAAARTAGFVGDAQVARIDEANVVPVFG